MSFPLAETSDPQSQLQYIRHIFNRMADEYDHLSDLWYPHTFGFIDAVLAGRLVSAWQAQPRRVALDVACGTGIQSLRLASLGYRVVGVDISDRLLGVARRKLVAAGYRDAEFFFANAQALPFPDSFADCVNCCGPSLNFVPDWRRALAEMFRCLRPGGRLLLEVDGKWSFDLFWSIVNGVGMNFLGYGQPLLTCLRHLLPPWHEGHTIHYPFPLESGETIIMPVRLFSAAEITRELEAVGFVAEQRWGLHVLTNLIPSTVLHKPSPRPVLGRVFRALAAVEKSVHEFWPFNAFGSSLLILARKP